MERENQKKIVLGNKGAMVQAIGEAARRELEGLWERKVHLFLFVKVETDWKHKPDAYRYLGLEYRKG